MLVLSRKKMQALVCEALGLKITVLSVKGGEVRIGIEAPVELRFHRDELLSGRDASEFPKKRAA